MPKRIEYSFGDTVGDKGCTFIKNLPSTRDNNGKSVRMGFFSCAQCGKSFESSFSLVRNNKRALCDECSNRPKQYHCGDILATNPTIVFLEYAGSNKFKKRLAKVKNCETEEEFITILSNVINGHVKYGPESCKKERAIHTALTRRSHKVGDIILNPFQERFLLLEEKEYPYFKIKNLEKNIEFEGSVYNVIYGKSDGSPVSRGETNIALSLKTLNINFQTQKTFPDLLSKKGYKLRFDFYLPDHNCCIEYDGGQHFYPVEKWGGIEYLKDVQERDEIKNNYAQQKGIRVIRISYKDTLKISADYINSLLLGKESAYGK